MSFTGTWNLTVKSPMGAQPSVLTVGEGDGGLTGTQESQGDVNEIFDVKVSGDKVSWSCKVTKPMPITLKFSGKQDGDSIKGDVKVGVMGTFPWEALREGAEAPKAQEVPMWQVQDFSQVKVGISLNTMDFAPVSPVHQAQYAEKLGFDSVWVPQHSHVTSIGPRNKLVTDEVANIMSHMCDPFILLTAIAASTKTIRFGTAVALLAEYEPFAFAHMASTLDFISGGRMACGVGYGGNQLEAENRGINFFDRYEILDEKVKAIRTIWMNEEASFEGKFVKFKAARQFPKPVQKPAIPFHLGVVTDQRFDILAQHFDGWMPNIGTDSIERVERLVKSLDAAAERNNRDPKTIKRIGFRGFRSYLAEMPTTHVELHRSVSREEFKEICVNERDLEKYQEIGLNQINIGIPFAPNADEFHFMMDTLAEKLLK